MVHFQALNARLGEVVRFAKRPVVPAQKTFQSLFHRLLRVKNHVCRHRRVNVAACLSGSKILLHSEKPTSGFFNPLRIILHTVTSPRG